MRNKDTRVVLVLGPSFSANYARMIWHGALRYLSAPLHKGQQCTESTAYEADSIAGQISQSYGYWFYNCGGPVVQQIPNYNRRHYLDSELVYPTERSAAFIKFSALGKLIADLACDHRLPDEWEAEVIKKEQGSYSGQWVYKNKKWYIRYLYNDRWWDMEIPSEFIYACANTYPLHAYRGLCRGVHPREFLRFRAEQTPDPAKFLRELKKTTKELKGVPCISGGVADLRDRDLGPLVHEASSFLATPILQQEGNVVTIRNLSDEWFKAFSGGEFLPAKDWQVNYVTRVAKGVLLDA